MQLAAVPYQLEITYIYITACNISCSVANVHVTRVLSVDWMAQPNHGQQAIFKNSVLTQAIHLYRNSQMDRLTGNYDVIYRACTMTDREGQRD